MSTVSLRFAFDAVRWMQTSVKPPRVKESAIGLECEVGMTRNVHTVPLADILLYLAL